MKNPFLNRTTCAAVALTLAGLTGCATPPSTNAGWNVMFDKGSNLNDWTLLGDANWRIQDDAIQADFLRSKTASFLVSKKVYSDFQIRAEIGRAHV